MGMEVGCVAERVPHVAGSELEPADPRGDRDRREECVIGDEDAEGAAEVEGREPHGAVLLRSMRRSRVMRKPEMTKNTRTPSAASAAGMGALTIGKPRVP